MGQLVPQHSFAGGEVAPEFYGNTRNPRHAISLRTCKNFLPIVHGALVNRAGTFNRGAAKASTMRFEVFVFSDAQAFVLEFTNLALRFWTPAGQVLNAGVPYEIVTPYLAADLRRLKFSQSGDVITITCVNGATEYASRDLSRITNTNWVLAASAVSPPAGFVVKNLAPVIFGYGGDTATAWDAVSTFVAGQYVFDSGATPPSSFICLATNTNKRPNLNPLYWAPAVDATHIPRVWDYVITIKYKDELGRKLEGLPSAKLGGPNVLRGPDRPISCKWDAPDNPGFDYVILGFGVYAGRNGLFGWVNDADPTATTFKDDGTKEPNYAIQPPKGTDPFLVADGVNTAATHSHPAAVTHHELRRVYGGMATRPNHFIGSKQDNYENFDVNFPVQETDSYDFGIASGKLQDIRSFLSLMRLLIFTGDAVFAAEGQQGSTIKPTSVQVRPEQGEHGCSYLQPLAIGNVGLYVTSKGNYIRDVFFNWQVNGLDGLDLTEYARHLFKGHTIIAWCYTGTPYKLVWAVRDDGLLLSLTYDRATQTIAFAQHPTAGAVLDVASIPNGTEDALMLCVLRNGSPRVEIMASRDYISDIRLACFLDSALQFDGRNVGATTMRVSGASYGAEDIVTITASVASFAAGDVDDQVVICPDGIPAVLDDQGEEITPAVPSTRITVTQYTSTTVVQGRLEAPLPAQFQNVASASWGWARDTLTGLGHLNGESVKVLADADVQGPFTVVAGNIGPLSPPALIATVGLPYNSDAETLDLAADAVKSNVKAVSRVLFDVSSSRGILAGETFDADDLLEAKLRTVEDDFEPTELVTGQVEVLIGSSWNTGGRACVRQSDPLPLTITSLYRDVEVGGRGG